MVAHETKGRIIIADDVPHVRASLRLMFTAMLGLDVVGEASNGQELLALLATTPVDIMIVDRNIPGLEDPAVVEQIRQRAPESRILLVNVFERDDGVRPCPLQADYTISKSLGPDHWLREVKRMLMSRPPGIINLAIEADKHIHDEIAQHAVHRHDDTRESLHANRVRRIEETRARRVRADARQTARLHRALSRPTN